MRKAATYKMPMITDMQIRKLAKVMGQSQANVIVMAVDRLFVSRQEVTGLPDKTGGET